MLTLETLAEGDLREVLNDQSLHKARGYLNRIKDPVRRNQTLSAQVRGSYWYQVEVGVLPGGIHAQCSCPYAWGGYCKHVAAVLLKWLREPGSFAVEPPGPDLHGYPLAVTPVEPPPSSRPDKLPAWLAGSVEERQQRDCQQLASWLNGITLQDLRGMTRQRGWIVRGTRKADVIAQVLDRIDDPKDLSQALAGLDREHDQVLRALVLSGDDQVRFEDVARVAGMWGVLENEKQIETFSYHLCAQGLAFPGSIKANYGDSYADFVPPALIRHLPPLLEGIIPTRGDPSASSEGGDLQLADPYALVRAASQLALVLEQAPVPLRPPMPRPHLERFHRELQGWDYDPVELAQVEREGRLGSQPGKDLAFSVPPPACPVPDQALARLAPLAGGETQFEFLYALLLAAGILQPGSPITVWLEVKAEFLSRDELAQRALLARLYLDLSTWSELWLVLRADDRLQLKRAWRYSFLNPERLRTDLARFRRRVLRVLACLPDDRWVQIADLEPLLRAIWPLFEGMVWDIYHIPLATGSWFLERNGSPLNPGDPDDWNVAQGAFLRQTIAGPLHWLGLADLHFDSQKLLAFRLHGLADLYWDRIETPSAPRHASIQARSVAPAPAVTADEFSVTINPSAVSAQAHSLLDKIARLEVTEPGRFVYRLDAQAAYQAFENGAALDDLLADWQRLLAVPMPQAIHEQLDAWWAAYGRVRLYENLTVVEFGDDYALAEMKAVTSLEQFLVAEISPRLVIVRPDGVDRLVAELERAGYTPKRTDEV
jgi:hypothetical protein